jgi:hypothetical protein
MGFLSSLFGYSDQPATTSVSKVATVPPELKPYVEQAMKDTQALYEQRMEEGYRPYPGDTIAPLTPEEIASEEGLKSLVGTQLPFQEESLGLMRGAARKFTPETAEQFMSPYMRNVIEEEKRQAQRQYERTTVPEFERQAVAAGGMSGLGTRAGVEAAERANAQNRLIAGIETKGLQKAYQDAQAQFRDQLQRERTLGSDIATAGKNLFASGISEQGLLKNIGTEKRDIAQSVLDEAYKKYIEERQFPEQQLARYQSSIYGNPLLSQPNYQQTKVAETAQPSMWKNLLGLGLGATMAYGGGGGGTAGGWNIGTLGRSLLGQKVAVKTGGQIGGLSTLYRKVGGQVEPDDEGAGLEADPKALLSWNPQTGYNVPLSVSPDPNAIGPEEKARQALYQRIGGNPLRDFLGEWLKGGQGPAAGASAALGGLQKGDKASALAELSMKEKKLAADAKLRAAQAKAKGGINKHKPSETRKTWESLLTTLKGVDYYRNEDGSTTMKIDDQLWGGKGNVEKVRAKLHEILVGALEKGAITGKQDAAVKYIATEMRNLSIAPTKPSDGKEPKNPIVGDRYTDKTGKVWQWGSDGEWHPVQNPDMQRPQ